MAKPGEWDPRLIELVQGTRASAASCALGVGVFVGAIGLHTAQALSATAAGLASCLGGALFFLGLALLRVPVVPEGSPIVR